VDTVELDKPADVKSNRGRQSSNSKNAAPKTFASKIFEPHEFGFRRITIERPLRESYQFSNERIESLRFAPKPFNGVMEWIYSEYGANWSDDPECEHYGVLKSHEADIRLHIKTHFSKLKEKQIKDVLDAKIWATQKTVLLKASALLAVIGTDRQDDMNQFDAALKTACKAADVSLDAKEKKQIINAVSWKNPDAVKVVKKVHKNTKANPLYGLFSVDGQTIEYKADSELRDYENVSLDPSQSVNAVNEAYFIKEVQPHVADAWIDANKKDARDDEVGIVGYEIPFNRHFYVYQPPRALEDIDRDLDKVSGEIMELLREVHS